MKLMITVKRRMNGDRIVNESESRVRNKKDEKNGRSLISKPS